MNDIGHMKLFHESPSVQWHGRLIINTRVSDSITTAARFTFPLRARVVQVYDTCKLLCCVEGSPIPEVTWYKDQKELSKPQYDITYIAGVATLTISDCQPSDSGTYCCVASNCDGTTETSCDVTVQGGCSWRKFSTSSVDIPEKVKEYRSRHGGTNGYESFDAESELEVEIDLPPRIVEHMVSQNVACGEPVLLSVRVMEAKNFIVTWHHNNKRIQQSKAFQLFSEANTRKLFIPEIDPEYSGVYTCKVSNYSGACFSCCTLLVTVPGEMSLLPKHRVFPVSLTVNTGEPAVFIAELDKPPLHLQWYNSATPVDATTSRFRFKMDGTSRYRFEISSSSSEDAGQYQVKATGAKGDVNVAFYLNVVKEVASSQ